MDTTNIVYLAVDFHNYYLANAIKKNIEYMFVIIAVCTDSYLLIQIRSFDILIVGIWMHYLLFTKTCVMLI